MKKACLFLAFLLPTTLCFAYPITPRPLRKLVIESEYIVLATVVKTGQVSKKDKKQSPYDYDYDFADLLIEEVWQNTIALKTIRVYYSAGLICPAPPQYLEGTRIVAFLDRHEKIKDAYLTHALSYGVKLCLTDETAQTFKARIQEMQQILLITDKREKEEKTMDWLVSCAENANTRWEGVYELSPGSDFMSYYDRDEPVRKEIYLSGKQRKRLFDAFMKPDSSAYMDLLMIDIVKGVDDGRLLERLKNTLIAVPGDEYWTPRYLMPHIVSLTGDSELARLCKQYEEGPIFSSEKKDTDKLKKLLDEFVHRMKPLQLKQTLTASGAAAT